MLTSSIKETLTKEYPQFAERISKATITLGKITTLTTNEKSKKSSCSVDKISLTFDTGDTLFYDNNNSRFDYSARQSKNGIQVNANLSNKFSDIGQNISDYYLGFGVMIDGVRKGGCNGTQSFKDEKKGLTEEIECANGIRNGVYKVKNSNGMTIIEGSYAQSLKDGVWKTYYENGVVELESFYSNSIKTGAWKWYDKRDLLLKEESYKDDLLDGVSKEYYPSTDKVRYSASYKAGLLDGLFEVYDEKGDLTLALPYKDNQLNGVGKLLGWEWTKQSTEDLENSIHESIDTSRVFVIGNEMEFKNGILISTRRMDKDENNKILDESIFLNDKQLYTYFIAESLNIDLYIGAKKNRLLYI